MTILLIVIILFILTVAASSVFFQPKKDIFEKSLALAAMGNYLDARGMVRGYLEGSPNDAKAHFVMSKIYTMEGDYIHEASHLEKIKTIGQYDGEFTPISVSNRIADIYYQNEMFEESLFHYLDSITVDNENVEALVRIAFMALGQGQFQTADYFFKKIPVKNVRFSSYFIGRGITEVMLGKKPDLELFTKAYAIDHSSINGFMYAMALYRSGNYIQAIEIANKIVDDIDEEYVRYTLFQFIMVQYILKNDYSNSFKHSRLCMETARMNGWKVELLDSEYYFSLMGVALAKYEEVTEALIDLESERVDDKDAVELANYKFALENADEAGNVNAVSYDINQQINNIALKIFPQESFFELSGMKADKKFNLSEIVSPDGRKLIKKLNMIGVDKLSHFVALSGMAFKNACVRLATLMKYRVSRELPYKENDGINFIAISKENLDSRALFRIRKWRGIKVADVFLRDMLGAVNDMNLDRAILIADVILTESAKTFLKSTDGKIIIVSGKELLNLLDETLV